MPSFMVIRGDDNGQNFIVQDAMDEGSATKLYESLLRGHKQWYAVCGYQSSAERAGLIDRYSLRV